MNYEPTSFRCETRVAFKKWFYILIVVLLSFFLRAMIAAECVARKFNELPTLFRCETRVAFFYNSFLSTQLFSAGDVIAAE
jgi:hypothetical protein